MEQLIESLRQTTEYPRNLVSPNTYPHSLHAYVERLSQCEDRLFCDTSRAALHFWECDDQGRGFQYGCARSLDDLEENFGSCNKDPRSRFVFVCAPNSRERLNVTRNMLSLLFTYHQVMPAFLDFVFSYGRREHAQELHFGGFRHDTRLADRLKGPNISQLGRSGQDIRHCYNLRSVEPSKRQRDWPWSIRQTAVYHSFDFITGRANWIVVKGDRLIEERIKSATEPFGRTDISCFDTNGRAFTSTLFTHLVYINWAGENWRWFIDFLEDEAQKTTRRTLSADVDRLPRSKAARPSSPISPKTSSFSRPSGPFPKQSSFGFSSMMQEKNGSGVERPTMSSSWIRFPSRFRRQFDLRLMPHERAQPDEEPIDTQEFSFSDLQRVQYLEEKTNESILVLEVNLSVLADLRQYYQSIIASDDFPEELKLDCKDDISRFATQVASLENDLCLQRSRATSLLRLLADRKNLLFGILEYQDMEASRLSAKIMEAMTLSMHEIAQETKRETVSMRIITLVTLFFLPGTFISTLMSTDIIQWNSDQGGPPKKTVSVGAIQFFMAISVPLMLVTFSAWYGVYWWVNRKEDRTRKHREGPASQV